MAIDDRKQRVLTAIVSLYSGAGEPVGSTLLSRYFDMAVSSATLRNEMAALTKLGLLEQPHTSAGRVPSAKGYRYYLDHLLETRPQLSASDRALLEGIFRELDYDPEKLAEGAAKALADLLGCAVVATTPRAEDVRIAHFELIQVGRSNVAVLAVTSAGGVRTRVARVEGAVTASQLQALAQVLGRRLAFRTSADVSSALLAGIAADLGPDGKALYPIVNAAVTLLQEAEKPRIFFEGQRYLLHWPELADCLPDLLDTLADNTNARAFIRPPTPGTCVRLGEDWTRRPMPGLAVASRRYLAGGGQTGVMAVIGPVRMDYNRILPTLEYVSLLLGEGMSGQLTQEEL